MMLTDCQQVILWALCIAPEDPKGFEKYKRMKQAEGRRKNPELRERYRQATERFRKKNPEQIPREREYAKQYKERFPERLEIDSNRRREMSRNYDLLKMDRPCYDCGGVFLPCQMDWDHLPRFKKCFTIGNKKMSRKFELVIEEINKCQLVCASCHRLRTESRKQQKDKVS